MVVLSPVPNNGEGGRGQRALASLYTPLAAYKRMNQENHRIKSEFSKSETTINDLTIII